MRATGCTAQGSLYYDSSIPGGEDLPITLTSLVVGAVHVVGSNRASWPVQATSGTTATAPTWYADRATKNRSHKSTDRIPYSTNLEIIDSITYVA